eukprot:3467658-Lingulodinium_polyedra.AAC.1
MDTSSPSTEIPEAQDEGTVAIPEAQDAGIGAWSPTSPAQPTSPAPEPHAKAVFVVLQAPPQQPLELEPAEAHLH